MIDLKTLGIYSLSLVLSGSLFAADADFLKNKLEKEGILQYKYIFGKMFKQGIGESDLHSMREVYQIKRQE